jgi:hypothetical protein
MLSFFSVAYRHIQQKPVENKKTEVQNPAPNGTAIVITGAAARISREAALLEKLGVTIQRFSHEGFISRLRYLQKKYSDPASRTYVYIPDFQPFSPMLNFNTLEKQYKVTSSWPVSHKQLPVNEYLAEIDKP